jgi:phosphoribosylformimino-5-aminoimidazole carboxamide ribotide isomerase
MIVLPVIDVMNGKVVRAIRGNRNIYRPLYSWLTNNAEPIELINNLIKIGFSKCYIADLDGIRGIHRDTKLYSNIARKISVYLDSGIQKIEDINMLLQTGVSRVVIATETISDLNIIFRSIKMYGSNKIIVSIDYKNKRILSASENIGAQNLKKFLEEIRDAGVKDIIFIDLDRVGGLCGVEIGLIRELTTLPFNLYVGGGIRDINDIISLENLGVFGVLVASALHLKKITINELRNYGYI